MFSPIINRDHHLTIVTQFDSYSFTIWYSIFTNYIVDLSDNDVIFVENIMKEFHEDYLHPKYSDNIECISVILSYIKKKNKNILLNMIEKYLFPIFNKYPYILDRIEWYCLFDNFHYIDELYDLYKLCLPYLTSDRINYYNIKNIELYYNTCFSSWYYIFANAHHPKGYLILKDTIKYLKNNEFLLDMKGSYYYTP